MDATKPQPDLVVTAVEKAGGGEAVLVGDSTFDCEAAARAGVPALAVLTGGFSAPELRDAGAVEVFESNRGALRASGRDAAALTTATFAGRFAG